MKNSKLKLSWWRHSGVMVASWWRFSGAMVAAWWRHGGVIVALWWRHGGVVVASWWRHGGVMVALVYAPKPLFLPLASVTATPYHAFIIVNLRSTR